MSNSIERRTIPLRVEFRSDEGDDAEAGKIAGTAIVFNRDADIGGLFTERIAPDALDGVLDRSDVRALFNHNPDKILGRSSAGTLDLRETDDGLDYEVDLPDTTVGRDVRESVRRGDVSGSSFAFSVAENGDEWEELEDGRTLRTIRQFDEIFDVSPVVFPAYEETQVSARAEKRAKELREPEPDFDHDAERDRTLALQKRQV